MSQCKIKNQLYCRAYFFNTLNKRNKSFKTPLTTFVILQKTFWNIHHHNRHHCYHHHLHHHRHHYHYIIYPPLVPIVFGSIGRKKTYHRHHQNDDHHHYHPHHHSLLAPPPWCWLCLRFLWEKDYPLPFLQADHISTNCTTTQTCCLQSVIIGLIAWPRWKSLCFFFQRLP